MKIALNKLNIVLFTHMLYNILGTGGIFMPATITHAYFSKDVYESILK